MSARTFRPRLTDEHRLTIRLALRGEYDQSMKLLDFHGGVAGVFLRSAGNAWDAYKAFTGRRMHEPVTL